MVEICTRLDIAMTTLGCSSTQLSQHCSISNSLISRWRNGSRKLTVHSDAALALAEVLVGIDDSGKLDPLLEPYRIDSTDKQTAMWLYLVDTKIPSLPADNTEERQQENGEYVSQQYHLFGKKGFQKGALLMLDYIDQLPESQEIIVCALNDTKNLWHNEIMFALRFLRKLKRAISSKTSFTIVENYTDRHRASPHFSIHWLTHNLKGIFIGRVFRGEAPECFIAVIPGYWSGTVEKDPTVKDGIISTFSTDPRTVRKTAELCRKYVNQCLPPSQYGFLSNPQGDEENPRKWPTAPDKRIATADFSMVSRLPIFGVMTKEELKELGGITDKVQIPQYLFNQENDLPENSRYFILCADSLQNALNQSSTLCGPLSSLFDTEVRIPREMVRRMVQRLIRAMESIDGFQVALVPKRAFERIEMEYITWADTLAIGWLQDGSESLLDTESTVVASFDSATEHTWSTLSKRWKDQKSVLSTLSRWLQNDNETDNTDDDSAAEPGFPYLRI